MHPLLRPGECYLAVVQDNGALAKGTHKDSDISNHTHDDRYYTESEVDTLLAGKADSGHAHDDRYYTESEVDTMLAGKATSSHNHSAGEITSGTLAVARGGTNQTTLTPAVGTAGLRTIYAGTSDMTAGTTALTTGAVYFVYE